jgi:hypothetical protein
MGLPGRGGQLSGEQVVAAVELEANKTDNRTKLGRASSAIRHLAVVFDDHNGLGRTSMLEGFVPDRPAALPPEITTAWAISRYYGGSDEYLVWRNKSGAAWEVIGTIEVDDAAIVDRAG